MRVRVDSEACTGHGRCYSLFPDVFDADDQGHSLVMVEQVEGEGLRHAEAATSNCPERAISLVEE